MMPRGLIALACTCSLVALISTAAGAQTSANRTFASAEEAVKTLLDIVKTGDRRRAAGGVRAGRQRVDRLVRPRGRASEPAGLRHRGARAMASRGRGPRSKDAGHRLRGVAVSRAAGERRQRMAVRHGGGEGRSAGAADRTQRAVGDRNHPSLCERAAALRAARTRRQATRACTRRSSGAILARRTACTGRPGEVRSGVHWGTWSHRPRRRDARWAVIARSLHRTVATTSRS